MREVRRMEGGEKRVSRRPPPGGYERELRLAGLAQRVAQAYTIIEGVLAFVARRIDRVPGRNGVRSTFSWLRVIEDDVW